MRVFFAAVADLPHDPFAALVAAIVGLGAGVVLAFTLDYAYRDGRDRVHRSASSWPPRRRLGLLPAAAAIVTVLSWYAAGGVAEAAITTVLALIFVALAAADLERHLLPNRLIYPAIPLAFLLAPWLPASGHASSALGAALGLVVMLVPYIAAPRALGAGDVKLAALIGAFAGARLIFTALAVGAILGAIVSLAILVRGRQFARTRIAYGPYLVLGALLVALI